MSFGFADRARDYEYAGSTRGFFDQPRNLTRRSHWRLFSDMRRFFSTAATRVEAYPASLCLGAFLTREGYSDAFIEDHILPMGAAIWSSDADEMLAFPARTFLDFYGNHGLLQMVGQPAWRTVAGGSRHYVDAVLRDRPIALRAGTPVRSVTRQGQGVDILFDGGSETFDAVVLATHADTSLRLLDAPDQDEAALLSTFRFQENVAILHTDPATMPNRRRLWSSWNYVRVPGKAGLSMTYWMNNLQPLDTETDLFVTLNPAEAPDPARVLSTHTYQHPLFTADAISAQAQLWSLQGRGGVWHAGAWFGYGFHEDGIQSGLAVAEALGGERRPWRVPNESGRITIDVPALREAAE